MYEAHCKYEDPEESQVVDDTAEERDVGRGLGFWEKRGGHSMYTAARALLPHSEGF